MRTGTAERQIESTFKGRKTNFTIHRSAKAFQILSSNLYTDKPLAILRELSCNALDAHRDANNKGTPFKITLPTSLNPSLEIRDYGTGMTPDKVETQYNSVFWSDKNHSNDDVGGLGLGSKTPFSYTDTFTLISYVNGKKHTWLCYLDESGEPSTEYVSVENTDEHNGIHYMIPVKNEDFNIFREKARQALRYFPKDSFKINVDVPTIEYELKAEEYGLRKEADTGYYYRRNIEQRVLMGPVAYRLDKDALGEKLASKYSSLLDKPFDFFCNIGDIDIQASREALSYDKNSIKQIVAMLDRIAKRIAQDFNDKIAEEPTLLDAMVKARAITKGFSSGIMEELRWRSRKLSPDFDDIKWKAKYTTISSGSVTKNDALKVTYSTYWNYSPNDIKKAIFCFYDTTVQMNNVRLKKWIRQNGASQKMFLFQDEQDMLSVMAKYELTDNITTADLPLPSKVINEKTQKILAKTPVKIKIRTGGNGSFEEEDSDISDINKMKDVCWCSLFGTGDLPYKDNDDSTLHSMLSGITTTGFRCIGIPASLKSKEKLLTIPHIKDYARMKLLEYFTEEDIIEGIIHPPQTVDHYIRSSMPKKWHNTELYKLLEFAHSPRVMAARGMANELTKLFGWKFKIDKSPHRLDELLKGKYKILTYAHNVYYERSQFIADAMKLIEGDNS